MVTRPEGLILVTGPTGSGKTTTLYSILQYLNVEALNIMTLEDPVEYPTAMIRQTSANAAAKLDFAGGIRSILRQDPDIILVGEIRDEDTADMALRAAMTGHEVFSTLHANSAVGAVPRLLDLGIKPGLLAGNIIGVIAQRLVRKLCDECKEPAEINRFLPDGLARMVDEKSTVYRPVGCPACADQGYRGRMALMEILLFDADLDELVARHGTCRALHSMARTKGFRTLVETGMNRVVEGSTSLDELARVVDLGGNPGWE